MKPIDFYKLADKLAPRALSDELCRRYGMYDNSGLLVDADKEVTGAVFSLDFSDGAVETAIEKGYNLIVTHHPAIYSKIANIRLHERTGKLVRCLERGISVLSMHLNLDSAAGGIDESLMRGVAKAAVAAGGKKSPETEEKICLSVEAEGQTGGYGRAYRVAECGFAELVEEVKREFSTERIVVYGDGNRKVSRIASFCGAGGDEESLSFAVREGAEVMISSDFKHHVLAEAVERGLNVIALTHYASEQYGFKEFYNRLRAESGISCTLYTDVGLM